ncbi:MAG: DUF3757 domain-containing protein [Rickettsia endosymbiont of Ixodes persulcatus]|nr:DUF3757 domain-containing protein [Rickettsia endosymbiont of Ixodes persulcatus]
MQRSHLLIGSLFFLFSISPCFATTCPSVEKINSVLEEKVYLNGGSVENGTNFIKESISSKNKIIFYNNLVKDFKGAYYQKKTADVKKSSLTCTYTLNSRDTYFNLKLRDADADTVDTTSFNKDYWSDFYGHGLYSCENNVKGVSVNNCAFTLNTYWLAV